MNAALLPRTRCINPLGKTKFDCIVAFDVFKHLTHEEVEIVFSRLAVRLIPGGKILLRVPNGESPFYLPLQNADPTHQTHMTRLKIEYLCLAANLQLETYRNSARVTNRASVAFIMWICFCFRDLLEISIGHAYYFQRRPLDPNATVVLSARR